MSKIRFKVGVACLLLFVVVAPSAAHAGDPNADAEELIRRGIQLRKNRDDAAAVREFQKAYDLSPSPRAAGQLGLAQQALGRWVDAERHVGEAMRAANDPWVARNRAALDQSLAVIQDHLGRVEITGDPAGAEVLVNGRPVGKLPLTEAVRVSAGQVDIDLRAPGFVPVQRTLTIVGGQYQPVVIHLVREAAPTAARATAPPQQTSSPDPAPPVPPETQSEADGEPQPSNLRVALKWTAAGLAGAGLATGVVGYLVYRQNVNEFDSSPKRCGVYMGSGYSMLTNTPDKTCQTLLDNYELGEKVAIVGGIAAGVFAASWLILYLTEPTGASTQQASRWPSCGATTGSSVGIACMGRF